MIFSRRNMGFIGITILFFLAQTIPASACTTCFGNPAEPQTQGMQAAILTMLGFTYFTVTGLLVWLGFILFKGRNARSSDFDKDQGGLQA